MIFVHSLGHGEAAMAIHELAVLNGTEAVFQGIDEDDGGGVTAIDAEGARRSVAVSDSKPKWTSRATKTCAALAAGWSSSCWHATRTVD